MKNIVLIAGLLLFSAISCESQTSVPNAKISQAINSDEFIFNAENVTITNADVNQVLSSMPGNSASRASHLSPGYTLKVSKSKISCDLPFFGRMYNPSFDTTKNSLNFESNDFEISKSTAKKGKTSYQIVPKDNSRIRRIWVEVYNNGKAYVSVNSNDREPANYDGYITAN